MEKVGNEMYNWAKDIFPYNRSITGQGVRDTLLYFKKIIPELKIKEMPTGKKIFDWEIPNEWNVEEAYIEDEQNNRIIDFKNNNLHILGYSSPVDKWMDLEELNKHLYSSKDQPNVIPYVTSYYKERWGFCLSHNDRINLKNKKYHVVIKSELKPGFMNYGEIIIPGDTEKEILMSTYICHPSLANNELSGPIVTIALAREIINLKDRNFTYRIILIPETIGAIAYLSENHKLMKEKTVAGFVYTCVGDNRAYSFMPSRLANTYADKIANHIIKHFYPDTKRYSFLQRGSDERQFCNPLIDLPVVSLMRTKYAEYPEYHTSADNLEIISPEGLKGGFYINYLCIKAIEINKKYLTTVMGEPKMDKRGLRPSLGAPKVFAKSSADIMNFLIYSDGSDLISISERIDLNIFEANKIAILLLDQGLIKIVN